METQKQYPICDTCGYQYSPEQPRHILFLKDLETGQIKTICEDCLDNTKGESD